MALVNPQIAMSYRPTTEYQPRNALAEYAQLQSIMGGQRQAELARGEVLLILEERREDREETRRGKKEGEFLSIVLSLVPFLPLFSLSLSPAARGACRCR